MRAPAQAASCDPISPDIAQWTVAATLQDEAAKQIRDIIGSLHLWQDYRPLFSHPFASLSQVRGAR